MDKFVWKKGYDFIDNNSPRYYIDDHEYNNCYRRFQVVIIQESYSYKYRKRKNAYFVTVYDRNKEYLYSNDKIPFSKIKEAKQYAEECISKMLSDTKGNWNEPSNF